MERKINGKEQDIGRVDEIRTSFAGAEESQWLIVCRGMPRFLAMVQVACNLN